MIDPQESCANTGESHFEYNLQPPAGILNVFSRLSYSAEYAIAEFVDNSTQSYFLHSDELDFLSENYVLKIEVNYDSDNNTLTAKDNAYGMNRERFLDAITLDAKNDDQTNSRNEFGMGLKTAASWFGNIWTVESTELDATEKYTATVNIPYLNNTGENNIEISVSNSSPLEHGTTITISDLTKHIGGHKPKKIQNMLASMYRRDLATGKIEIYYNEIPISFEPYPILTYKGEVWKKDLDFTFTFKDKEHRVKGFVAIMEPGGHSKAGLALFRRNRVVVGGEGTNYKPSEIFGVSGSQVGLKLFGELDLDDFPVNQAKDGFIWDDGLEDYFIAALKNNIRDYISFANKSKKERQQENQYSEEISNRVQEEVAKSVTRSNNAPMDQSFGAFDDANFSENEEKFVEAITSEELAPNFESKQRKYNLKITDQKTITFRVAWTNNNNQEWISLANIDGTTKKITINVDHPFFKPFVEKEDFKIVLEKLVLSIAASECAAYEMADQYGRIPCTTIRKRINMFLERLAQE